MLCQLECASEVESGLGETLDWVLKWLVNLIAGKTQLVSFDWFNNSGAFDEKIDRSVLEGKASFKMLGLSLSILHWSSYTASIAKIAAFIFSMKFLSPEVTFYLYK